MPNQISASLQELVKTFNLLLFQLKEEVSEHSNVLKLQCNPSVLPPTHQSQIERLIFQSGNRPDFFDKPWASYDLEQRNIIRQYSLCIEFCFSLLTKTHPDHINDIHIFPTQVEQIAGAHNLTPAPLTPAAIVQIIEKFESLLETYEQDANNDFFSEESFINFFLVCAIYLLNLLSEPISNPHTCGFFQKERTHVEKIKHFYNQLRNEEQNLQLLSMDDRLAVPHPTHE